MTTLTVPTADPRIYMHTRLNSPSDLLILREIFSENVYEIYDGDLTDTGTIVDLGANIGAFSLYGASLGAKKIVAVEPEPDNIKYLKSNIESNRHIFDCEYIIDEHAIGGQPDRIYISDEHGNSRKASEGTLVEQITLQQLFERYHLEYIDILKIDIEGMEGEVILNTPKHIMQLCRYITIEYDQTSDNLGEIAEKLLQTHQIKALGSNGGMIYAKRY